MLAVGSISSFSVFLGCRELHLHLILYQLVLGWISTRQATQFLFFFDWLSFILFRAASRAFFPSNLTPNRPQAVYKSERLYTVALLRTTTCTNRKKKENRAAARLRVRQRRLVQKELFFTFSSQAFFFCLAAVECTCLGTLSFFWLFFFCFFVFVSLYYSTIILMVEYAPRASGEHSS